MMYIYIFWLVTVGGLEHNWMMTFHFFWEEGEQVTFTPSFFRGVGGSTTNQLGSEPLESIPKFDPGWITLKWPLKSPEVMLGISSSQLTFTPSFFRGVETTNQIHVFQISLDISPEAIDTTQYELWSSEKWGWVKTYYCHILGNKQA